MRFLYTTLWILLIPFLFLRLWFKGKKLPAYRERIFERLAIVTSSNHSVDIWIHAVSLGEVIAVTPVVEGLLSKGYCVLLTSTTATGSYRVQQTFGERVLHQYFPYDLPWVINKFLHHYRPKLIVMMETEIWPNLVWCVKKVNLPLLLMNARLSESSLSGYLPIKFWFQSILKKFDHILTQTQKDKERFLQLGAIPENVEVIGNVKFDLSFSDVTAGRFDELKERWGASRVLVLLASTHNDEESQIIAYYNEIKHHIPEVLFMIAPRHPERFDSVYQSMLKKGLRTVKASQPVLISPEAEVIILDSVGELMSAYAVSDYAFVGGSLVPVGGHNLLEPIAMDTPVFSGPYIHNFKAIGEILLAEKSIQIVGSAEDFVQAIITLHVSPDKKRDQILRAKNCLMSHRGVIEKYLKIIAYYCKNI